MKIFMSRWRNQRPEWSLSKSLALQEERVGLSGWTSSVEALVAAIMLARDNVSFLFLLHFLPFAPSELLHIHDISAARRSGGRAPHIATSFSSSHHLDFCIHLTVNKHIFLPLFFFPPRCFHSHKVFHVVNSHSPSIAYEGLTKSGPRSSLDNNSPSLTIKTARHLKPFVLLRLNPFIRPTITQKTQNSDYSFINIYLATFPSNNHST
jgi:hypothetical protein